MSDAPVSTTGQDSGESNSQSGSETIFNLAEMYGEEHEKEGKDEVDEDIVKEFESNETEEEPEEEPEDKDDKKDDKKKDKKKQTTVEEDEDTDSADSDVPTYVNIPDEIASEALYDPSSLKTLINSSFHQYENRMQNTIMETAQRIIGAVEVMMHLHEYSKQYPEISKYPNVMQKLIAKHASAGDPSAIVQNAVNEYLSAYRRYSSMPKGPGRVVDVRDNKTPPKKSGPSVQSSGAGGSIGDPNNIGYLAAVLNRALKR